MSPVWKLRRGAPGIKPEVLDRIVFGTLILNAVVDPFFMAPKVRHALLMPPYVWGGIMILLVCIAAFLSIRWAFWVWAIMTGSTLFLQAMFAVIYHLVPQLFPRQNHINWTGFAIDVLEFIYVVWRLKTWVKLPEPQALKPRKATS